MHDPCSLNSYCGSLSFQSLQVAAPHGQNPCSWNQAVKEKLELCPGSILGAPYTASGTYDEYPDKERRSTVDRAPGVQKKAFGLAQPTPRQTRDLA